jgi:5-methylcytosine-specific restriction protein A
MPYTPVSDKCRELGCNNLKTNRSAFCIIHGGEKTQKDKDNSKLYSTAYWKKQRIAQLSKAPLCQACLLEGRVIEAVAIDHIFPHRQDANKFKNNLFQSLCVPHHTLKTQEENDGKYLYYSPNGLITYTDADYGQALNETKSAQNI